MSVADLLPGLIQMLGDDVRNDLARATESDDLSTVRKHLKAADEAMKVLIQRAKDAQAEIDGTISDAQQS
jgi:hypothetical protein